MSPRAVYGASRGERPDACEDAMYWSVVRPGAVVVAAVADGVGGTGSGARAARLAVDGVRERTGRAGGRELLDPVFWTDLLDELDARVHRDGDGGMTTLAAVACGHDRAIACAVGDSRVYLLRRGVAEALNEETRRSGMLGGDAPALFMREVAVARGDRLLLATDGLWKYLPRTSLLRWLAAEPVQGAVEGMLGELEGLFSSRPPDDATGVVLVV